MTWSPPEDNGGVEPVHYRGTVSNGTVLSFNTTGITMVTLTNLQHSTNYSVNLLAENIHGTSPSVEAVFRTPDSGECSHYFTVVLCVLAVSLHINILCLVPIIDVVRPKFLSLVSITVTITLLTTGGQDVTAFNVSTGPLVL